MASQQRSRKAGASGLKVIRDAVHGDIEVSTRLELPLIDTPEFQRLRGIKQLGTAHLVYPCALHTRFEHSLGTAHLARRLLGLLAARGLAIDPQEADAVVVAALLHDITHIPYGHTFEDERKLFPRHDNPGRTRSFLRAGQLGERLRALGLAGVVEELLTGAGDQPWRVELTAAPIGADLLDYLKRDAYFCGLRLAYDERLFRYFDVADGRLVLRLAAGGRVRQDLLSEVVHLLRTRYTLTERVFFHHTKVVSGAMISKAVEHAVDRGLEVEQLFPLRDAELPGFLRAAFPDARQGHALLEQVAARRLYKRCYRLGRRIGAEAQRALVTRFHADRASRAAEEATLAEAAGLAAEDVIIYCPGLGMGQKDAAIPVLLDDGPPRLLSDLQLPEIETILDKHRSLWCFDVFLHPDRLDRRDALSAACAERFGLPNQRRALDGHSFAG